MSFWNEEERTRLDKMQSEFLAWKKESSKQMEEMRKKIESFFPPRTSPVSQAPPIQPTPPAEFAIKFVVVGDLGQTGWTNSTLQHIAKSNYDMLLLPGDLSYNSNTTNQMGERVS
jgi:hypothetical protein